MSGRRHHAGPGLGRRRRPPPARARPRSASAAESRPAPGGGGRAQRDGVALRRPGRSLPPASRAGSPATGSKRRTVRVGVAGPSGTGGRAVTPAALSPSSRSKGRCRRGKASSVPVAGAPGRGQGLGQRRLLVEELQRRGRGSGAARPARPASPPAAGRGARLVVVDEGQPRLHAVELLALGQAVPHRARPRAAAVTRAGRRLAQRPGSSDQLAAAEECHRASGRATSAGR